MLQSADANNLIEGFCGKRQSLCWQYEVRAMRPTVMALRYGNFGLGQVDSNRGATVGGSKLVRPIAATASNVENSFSGTQFQIPAQNSQLQ